HPVRATDAEGVAMLARALDQRRAQLARAPEEDLPRRGELKRQRGVENVRAGEPEVDPAAGSPRRLRQHVDERRHVVIGYLFALVDGLDRERRGTDRVELLSARPGHLLAGGDLDAAPGLHPRLVRPDG